MYRSIFFLCFIICSCQKEEPMNNLFEANSVIAEVIVDGEEILNIDTSFCDIKTHRKLCASYSSQSGEYLYRTGLNLYDSGRFYFYVAFASIFTIPNSTYISKQELAEMMNTIDSTDRKVFPIISVFSNGKQYESVFFEPYRNTVLKRDQFAEEDLIYTTEFDEECTSEGIFINVKYKYTGFVYDRTLKDSLKIDSAFFDSYIQQSF